MTHAPGPTLADLKGVKRARKLEQHCVDYQLQILERQQSLRVMAEEAEVCRGPWEEDPVRLRALVDRPDLGELKRDGWC